MNSTRYRDDDCEHHSQFCKSELTRVGVDSVANGVYVTKYPRGVYYSRYIMANDRSLFSHDTRCKFT